MYRVTPVFENENLVCKGVQMEGHSVEDDGKGICFNVFCYNAQPSVRIDYETGESCLIAKTTQSPTTQSTENEASYDFILNINSKKFHSPDCTSVNKMAKKNKKSFNGKRSELINDGYTPCKICEP
jgi:DNA-entry nuclease